MAQRAQHLTTVANTVATVVLASDYQTIDVVNISAGAAIYVRTDGVDPTIKGDECDVVVAALGAFITVEAPGQTTEIRVITAAGTDVAVVGRTK